MIDKLLEQLRTQLENSDNLPDSAKQEILRHVEAIEHRTTTPGVEAGTLISATDETSSEEPQGLDKLVASVEELEASHPELTALVNRVAVALGNMGI